MPNPAYLGLARRSGPLSIFFVGPAFFCGCPGTRTAYLGPVPSPGDGGDRAGAEPGRAGAERACRPCVATKEETWPVNQPLVLQPRLGRIEYSMPQS